MKKLNNHGFSMIELLVVLLIIGVLAAVAAPLFLGNAAKAKVSEAVAGAGSIRSAERNYNAQNGGYLQVNTAALALSYFGTGSTSNSSALGVSIHGNKYFSPEAYQVTTGAGLTWAGTPSGVTLNNPQDFLITVLGSNSVGLATDSTDGAASFADVGDYEIQMDNTGMVIYTTNTGASPEVWNKF